MEPYIPGRGHKKLPADMHWSTAAGRKHQLTPEQRAAKQAHERAYAKRTGRHAKQYQKTGKQAHRLRLYGLTQEKHEALLAAQNHRCPICGVHKDLLSRGLVVDHSHTTGEVRGLLCDPCNKSIGMMEESQERLRAAADYLGRF